MKNQKTRKFLTCSTVFASLLAVAILALNFTFVEANSESDCDHDCHQDLVTARNATVQYQYIEHAVADDFVQVSPCVQVPGLGAMGFHFANFARGGNPNLDPAEPETLLYLPDNHGVMQLVALEYARFGPPMPPAPTLFGQEFTYNSQLNAYTLHVWIWRNNPSGLFAQFNPELSCPPIN